MPNRSPLLSCLVWLAVGISACGAPADAPAPSEGGNAEAEVTAAMADFRTAALAGDIDDVLGLVSSDARFAEPGVSLAGDELDEFLRGLFASADVQSFETRPFDRFMHGDAAYELGEYDEVVVMDGQKMTVEGHYFLRWERGDDGVWRMDRLVTGPREVPGGM